MRKPCIIPTEPHRYEPASQGHLRRSMCDGHYRSWLVSGCLSEWHGVAIPGAYDVMRPSGPNPWADVAPLCPRCELRSEVYLWATDCERRWFCQRCRRRFDRITSGAEPETTGPSDRRDDPSRHLGATSERRAS